MDKGYKFGYSTCPECGKIVADNWYIRHMQMYHKEETMNSAELLQLDDGKLTQQEVKQILDAAAECIRALPQDAWSSWAIYLLEILDTGDEGFMSALKTTHEAIRARLEGGQW
jgi:hypothetical protein